MFTNQNDIIFSPSPTSHFPPDMIQSFCSQLLGIVQLFFENHIDVLNDNDVAIKGANDMATKINRKITIDGKTYSIRANSEQEYAEKIIKKLGATVTVNSLTGNKHNFEQYARNWFEAHSPTIETATAVGYEQLLKNHLIPALGDKAIEDITINDIQRMFNDMSGAKTTKQKTRIVLNMIFNSAYEDGLISRNLVKSSRLKITGKASQETAPYTVKQMQYLVEHLDKIQNPVDRAFLALQGQHPLRLEEVLGLKWADIDFANMTIHIRRAATHPTRNRAVTKETKTEDSKRDTGLCQTAVKYLTPGKADEFVLGGKEPLSYSQVRGLCKRIQRDTGFSENITPRRFRTTVLTDIYDQTHDIKQTQAAAGHTTPTMTLKHYVKGRGTASEAAAAIDRLYGGTAV